MIDMPPPGGKEPSPLTMIRDRIAGVILAGGRSARMIDSLRAGGDPHPLPKARQCLAGKMLIEHVAERLRPQVACLVINTNDNPGAYRHLGVPVVGDLETDYSGPLMGLVTAMAYLQRSAPHIEFTSLVPCDAPFLPTDLVERLVNSLVEEDAEVACPRQDGFLQPTFSLWRLSLLERLQRARAGRAGAGIKHMFQSFRSAVVDWPSAGVDPFFNINTQGQLEQAKNLILQGAST